MMFKSRTMITSLAIIVGLTFVIESTVQAQMMGRFRGRTTFGSRFATAPQIGTPRIGNLFSGNMMSNRFGSQSFDNDMYNSIEPTITLPPTIQPGTTLQAHPMNWTPSAPTYDRNTTTPGNTGPAPIVIPAPMYYPGTGAMIMPGCGCPGTVHSAMMIQPGTSMRGNYITIPAAPKMAPAVMPSEVSPVDPARPASDSKSKSVLERSPLHRDKK